MISEREAVRGIEPSGIEFAARIGRAVAEFQYFSLSNSSNRCKKNMAEIARCQWGRLADAMSERNGFAFPVIKLTI